LWYHSRRAAAAPCTYMDNLEQIWSALLSSDPARIRHVWSELTDDESLAVLAHLRRMRDEPGWDPTQRDAAAQALAILREQAQ
jgi:hypothetical protein